MKNTEKKDFLKVSRTTVTCEMVSSYSRRGEWILGQKNIFTEIIVYYVPTLVKSPTRKEFQWTPTRLYIRKTSLRLVKSKTAQGQQKREKIWKSVREKIHYFNEKNNANVGWFCIRNYGTLKIMNNVLFKALKMKAY